jgi:restriction endonuclease Mrr
VPENEPVIVPTPIPAPVSEPTPVPVPVEEPKPTPSVTAKEKSEEKSEKKPEVKTVLPVFDMTALFADKKTAAKPVAVERKKEEEKPEKIQNEGGRVEITEQKPVEKPVEKTVEKPVVKAKAEEKPKEQKAPQVEVKKTEEQPKKTEQKLQEKKIVAPVVRGNVRKLSQAKPTKPLTPDEALKEAFLAKLRSLGGDYFEYYSVYLLERYSLRNGRRLECLKISGGERDGGIDGEIELTDKFGFRETIYIQAKNWDPSKGDEKKWVVGETLLQQFIGACVCKQAQAGKQNCRGIFITTSRFTPEAKRILENLGEKFVGYDGADLYETAKECGFGIVKKGEEWQIDEHLLSGEKAFFQMLP